MSRLVLVIVLACLVVPPARAQDAVRLAAEEALEQHFPADAERLSVRVLRTGGDADAIVRPQIVFPTADGLPRGRTQTKVEGTGGRDGWALLYVAHYDSVAVARTDIRRDEPVPSSALSVAWMETTSFHGEPLRAHEVRRLQEGGTLYANRPLREGRALHRDAVRGAYAAETGETVEMAYRRGALDLRLRCKAREPGFVGDVVRLYSDDTNTMYRARLVEPGRANWVETL